MIPVQLQPEPADFDAEVRQKGRDWLATKGIALIAPPPKASDLPNYWTRSTSSYGMPTAVFAPIWLSILSGLQVQPQPITLWPNHRMRGMRMSGITTV